MYSADEKRAMAMFSKEDQQRRQNKIFTKLRDMVENKNLNLMITN